MPTAPGADGWREVIAASADAGRYDQLRYEAGILAFILDEAGLPLSG